jgi:hypothetical protein
LPLPRKLPILQQFWLVKLSPFKHKSKRSVRELPVDSARLDFYCDLEFAVHRVEMRNTVLVEKHADDNAEEPRDFRHTR